MREVDRALLPGGPSNAAQAAADVAGARSKDFSVPDVIAPWSLLAAGGWDRRPVWRGCARRTLWDGMQIRG